MWKIAQLKHVQFAEKVSRHLVDLKAIKEKHMLWKLFHTLSVISASTQAWTNITSPIISEGSMQVKVQIVLFAISATQENKMNIY